jgi:hypothetical protein
MSPEEYLQTLSGLAFYSIPDSLAQLGGCPPALVHDGERLVQTLLRAGAIREAPDWGTLIDAGPVRRVQASGDAL